jgi:hypothetical protein
VPLSLLANYARKRKPKTTKLRIIAHGVEHDFVGGYGLKFGDKDYELDSDLITTFATAKDVFEEVVIAACQMATGPKTKAKGDGWHLCKQYAKAFNAPVWAADLTQKVEAVLPPRMNGTREFPAPPGIQVKMRPWRGNVYKFPADGGEPTLVYKSTIYVWEKPWVLPIRHLL